MTEIFDWVLALFSAVCGGSTLFTIFLYRKQQKRFKTAEAFEKEVVALKATVESLQRQIEFYETRLNKTQELVISKDVYISELSKDKSTVEVKHARNKSAMNRAYDCPFNRNTAECPVLLQKAENEEAYLAEIEKRRKQ